MTDKIEAELLQPPNPSTFVWFSLICSLRGGSTAALLTVDTAVNESRKKVADRVTRSPTRLCSRDGKLCYYRRLEYDFLFFFLALLPCFIVFFVCFSSSCCFVRAAVISSASTCCSRVICIISDLRIPFVSFVIYFSWFLFSWLACLLCSRTRYVCILFPTLIDEFALFCLLCPHNLYLSRMKNQDGHRVHRWCRWVERTVKCEDNNNDNNNNHSLLCPSIA